MKTATWLIFILTALMVAGCGAIEDMIQDATARTFTVSRTIHDSTSDRSFKSVLVIDELTVRSGGYKAGGAVSLEELADRIDVSRLGLADVDFFLRGSLENRSSQMAFVTVAAVPNGQLDQVVELGTLTLGPRQLLRLEGPNDAGAAAAQINANLADLLGQLDDTYQVNVVIDVNSAGAEGVLVHQLRIAGQPVYLRSREIDADGVDDHGGKLTGIHGATLTGTVTNAGNGPAEIYVYLALENEGGSDLEPRYVLVAETLLDPGATAAGEDMMIEEAGANIESAFKRLIDGQTVAYAFVAVSDEPLTIHSDNLRAEIKIDVEADIF